MSGSLGPGTTGGIHRGVSQHTNGFYNVLSWYTLNALLGNFDHAGGLIKASTYKADGSKAGQPFKISEANGGLAPFGTSVIRHGEKYDKHTLFLRDGYPAKRNWYPLSSDVYQEIVPSIGDAYPYPAKALIWYMGSPDPSRTLACMIAFMLMRTRMRVTKGGQISIPAAIRHRWGTSTVVLDDQGGRIVIEPASDDPIATAEGALADELATVDVAHLRRAARDDERAAESRRIP